LLFHHFPPSKYLKQTTSNYCLAISKKLIGVTLAIGSALFTARVLLLETEPVADAVPVSVVVAFGSDGLGSSGFLGVAAGVLSVFCPEIE
jgi:hypothetical protein